MLSAEEIERMCRVGKGTPMGELMRHYWLPFMLSSDLPEPDGEQVRVTLLGEELVAFRNTSGQVGLLTKYCAHRCADLWYARNEEDGLRCTYHGWKYDIHGNCVDMPSEPGERNFASKIKLTAYPVEERAGVLWTYMGPKEHQPELPIFEWMSVPEDQRYSSWNYQECNFVQAIEGGIDTTHSVYLHSNLDSHRKLNDWKRQGEQQANPRLRYRTRDNAPMLQTQATDFGVIVAGQYPGKEEDYWRFNLFYDPMYSSPPGNPNSKTVHAFVPLDDTLTARWSFTCRLDGPIPANELAAMRQGRLGVHSEVYPGTHWPTHNKKNNYQIDREMQRKETFTGIKDFGAQDYSVQEGMGPIQDRTIEHLGTSDIGIIAMRRRLMKLATDLQEGVIPYSSKHGEVYKANAGDVVLPTGVSWYEDDRTKAALATKF